MLSAKGYLSEKPRGDYFHVKDRIQVLSDLKPAPSPSSQDRPRRQLGRANCSGITLRDEKGQAQGCVVGVGWGEFCCVPRVVGGKKEGEVKWGVEGRLNFTK